MAQIDAHHCARPVAAADQAASPAEPSSRPARPAVKPARAAADRAEPSSRPARPEAVGARAAADQAAPPAGQAGSAAVELALMLPMLLLLLLITMEAGLILAEHVSVVNAAREGARFLVDGGADADVAAMASGNSAGLAVTDPSRYDVWVIHGQTSGGTVTMSTTAHSGNSTAGPSLTAARVQTALGDCNVAATLGGTPVAACGTVPNQNFVAVEVAYQHRGVTGSLLVRSGSLPLRSFSLVRKT